MAKAGYEPVLIVDIPGLQGLGSNVSFHTAYQITKRWEGGYANEPADRGGETYGGIARNFHPNWQGWGTIDFYKSTRGPIARGTIIPGMAGDVESFYHNMWTSGRFNLLNNQNVANLLFDYYVNSGATAIRAAQTIVKEMGQAHVNVDGVPGPQTMNAINAVNANQFHDRLRNNRAGLYNSIVARDPSQKVFYAGWMNRLAAFPILGGKGLVMVGAVGVGLAIAIYFATRDNKPKSRKK